MDWRKFHIFLNCETLKILSLQSNAFSGEFPSKLSNIIKSNDLSMFFYYKQSLVVNIKGVDRKYTTLLFLLTGIDLSGNNLHRDLP
ncbi:hypothetical protein CFP56_023427 [Quercus suber]|uniref:Uncharacterized protein n=1 Tax=Quercus suber TaxID=58331 RepID=A0AAW0KAC2_QUESU